MFENIQPLLKNNMVLVIGLVILMLLVICGYRLSNTMMMSKVSTSNTSTKSKPFTIVTPQCVFGALKNREKKVLVVNVLSEKMPIFIGVEGPDEERCISKAQFEALLEKNNGKVPKDIDMVVLMCAGWSCSAAKTYFEELDSRGVNLDRVVDYAGGIHEWCIYSKLNNNVFKVFNIRSPQNTEVAELSAEELTQLLRGTAHGYKTNTVIESKEEPSYKYCDLGVNMPDLL